MSTRDVAWYATSELTRPNVPVRLLLHGGEATGFMRFAQDPRSAPARLSAQRQWMVRRDSGAVDVLPYEPLAWRPLDGQPASSDPASIGAAAGKATAWPDPLPDPITLSSSGRFVDARPRRLAAMQRQAEQSARVQAEILAEIGEDPAARSSPASLSDARSRPAGLSARKDQWWLDAGLVAYSDPGHITLDEAEARVSRAILVDGLKAIAPPPQFAGVAAGLASLVAETITSADADRRPRFEAAPRDHADYLVAMRWFALIAPPEMRPSWAGIDWLSGAQKVLVWRALVPPMSWRQIARRAGGSQEGWRKAWGGALEMVRRVANGEAPQRHVKVADQLAALKERNRSWKRGA